jgi:hypothetical protein
MTHGQSDGCFLRFPGPFALYARHSPNGSPPGFRLFYPGNLAFVLFQIAMRILFTGVIGSPTTFGAEPFLRRRIPSDIFVFHRTLSHLADPEIALTALSYVAMVKTRGWFSIDVESKTTSRQRRHLKIHLLLQGSPAQCSP